MLHIRSEVKCSSAGRCDRIFQYEIYSLLRMLGYPVRRGAGTSDAGGIASFSDLDRVKAVTGGRIDVTIGSALSIYGGPLRYEDVLTYFRTLR